MATYTKTFGKRIVTEIHCENFSDSLVELYALIRNGHIIPEGFSTARYDPTGSDCRLRFTGTISRCETVELAINGNGNGYAESIPQYAISLRMMQFDISTEERVLLFSSEKALTFSK